MRRRRGERWMRGMLALLYWVPRVVTVVGLVGIGYALGRL